MNELQEKIYNRLSTRSRRAITKVKKAYGKPYHYSPRGHLLVNLSKEFGISIDDAYINLCIIRKHLLSQVLSTD